MPFSEFLVPVLAIIGTLGCIILDAQDLDAGSGESKIDILARLSKYVPTSIAALADGVGFCGMLYVLLRSLQRYGKPATPWLWGLIVIYGLASLFTIGDPDAENTLTLVLIFASAIMAVIVGITFMVKYDGEMKWLGLVFILSTCIPIAAVFILQDSTWAIVIALLCDLVRYERLAHTLSDYQIF